MKNIANGILAISIAFIISGCGGGEEQTQTNSSIHGSSGSIASESPSINHSLDFADTVQARQIHVDEVQYNGVTDAVFRDGFGRQALFRGWNVSGAVKLKSMGFKPFLTTADAEKSFAIMGKQTGANQIRFTIAWEGVNPQPDEIDYQYLDAVVAQMREAIKRRMYIVVDFHSDLYTRYTFTKDSNQTGNGAPEWIVKGGNHGTEYCVLACDLSWGAHKLVDPATRSAIRAFWKNDPVQTSKGTRYVQDAFLWQLGKVADYLNEKLTPEERAYILGIEPLNEPFDGGIKELGLNDYADFDNKILWPFYQRVRKTMDEHNMADKLVYTEPLVFWYTTTGIVAPATGYGYLKYQPGKRFVFSPHMYDQARMGIDNLSWVNNGAYLSKQDEVRTESRRMGTPMFLGEYGMWNDGWNRQDTVRVINASIQALETSNNTRQDGFADFYTPFVNGTQWHWDYYYDHHHEYLNDNPNKLITRYDAWNNENFSVIQDYGQAYTQSDDLAERIYPRRSQGDLMHFAYNAQVKDLYGTPLNWHSIRVAGREYFKDRKFAIMVWRGRRADTPSEIFIPRGFNPRDVTIITEKAIHQGLSLANQPNNTQNEVMLTKDPAQSIGSGYRLLVWDDVDADENSANSIHYALIVVQTKDMTHNELLELQQALNRRLLDEKQSALYLPTS